MIKRWMPFLAAAVFTLTSCRIFRPATADDGQLTLTLVQANDVYEIAPLAGGREGGIARLATIKKIYQQKNPNTLLVMAGDFLSPSIYNSLQYNGKAVRGKQMVAALNAAGLDLAVFGNHEFDIREGELQERLAESEFDWISTNAFHKTANGVAPFAQAGNKPVVQTKVLRLRDADGTTATVGLFSATLPYNKADYVHYTDALQAAREAYNKLKDSVDAVVALTHQSMAADELMARELPGLAAILGGHEHDGRYKKAGNTPITKALANARNVYIVQLQLNKKNGRHKVKTKTVALDESIAPDSATNAVVQHWNRVADDNYGSLGFEARKVVMNRGEPLDGRETAVRVQPTNLTRLVVAAIKDAAPMADIALLNGGSIRVDDVLSMPVTQYDILRTLPFGGAVVETDMRGSLVRRVLETGRQNIGTGGFLQFSENLSFQNDQWLLNGQVLDSGKLYRVVLPEFLLTGREANMAYLNPANVEVVKVYPTAARGEALSDIRLAVVRYLEKNKTLYLQ